jgi:NAD(P)-dependent dehydrogenase (short-subunit alcohol dehydrogenase family)
MAEAGADVACADIDEESAKATAAAVEGLGRRGAAIDCDVTAEDQVEATVTRTVAAFGRLDILFNNAGIADPGALPLHAYPTANWRAVLDVDLDGVFFCAREALKVMVRQQSGKIINIASIWGLAGCGHRLHSHGPDRGRGRDQRARAVPRLRRVRLHDRPDPGSRRRLPG